MSVLQVGLGTRGYPIVIEAGCLKDAGRHMLPFLTARRVIIVTDSTVAEHYLDTLNQSLDREAIAHAHIILAPGEQSKSFAELERLLNQLLTLNPDRKTVVIALGGGVIGDLTGFAASILLRGVDFIQIPTTLLSQVDSAVGGKTGINAPQGKNLIGTFHQPRLVLSDIDTLATLPRRELLAGYAEVVKYGIISNAAFFTWLEANGGKALAGNKELLAHMIYESCRAKAQVVQADERESGVRATLNFGHTLGHALEAEMGFSDKLLHGEAVAIGMILALKLSHRRGLCGEEDVVRVERHLKSAGLKTSPLEVVTSWNAERLIAHCHHDKKALGGKLTFILAEKIGKIIISHDIKDSDLQALLAEILPVV